MKKQTRRKFSAALKEKITLFWQHTTRWFYMEPLRNRYFYKLTTLEVLATPRAEVESLVAKIRVTSNLLARDIRAIIKSNIIF